MLDIRLCNLTQILQYERAGMQIREVAFIGIELNGNLFAYHGNLVITRPTIKEVEFANGKITKLRDTYEQPTIMLSLLELRGTDKHELHYIVSDNERCKIKTKDDEAIIDITTFDFNSYSPFFQVHGVVTEINGKEVVS